MLIIQTAFLGDVILATPVVSELKRLFPEAEIDFLVKKGNESLLDNNPYLGTVFILDKSKGKFRELLRLIPLIRKRKYDLVINLHRFGSSGLITMLSGAKRTYGFDKNPFARFYTKKFSHKIGDNTHEVSRNLALIHEFGAKDRERPQLFPSMANFEAIEAYCKIPFFCLAPASVWYTKQLPIEKWVELIGLLQGKGKIYLIGGKSDIDLCEQIIKLSEPADVINLCGQLNLLESAALMSKATRNFVNDSGPMHMASAMNAPVTAFFCSTIPAFGFGPLSTDAHVAEISEQLSCRPCGLHGHKNCPEGHFKCGYGIEINAVLVD